jgi:catalase
MNGFYQAKCIASCAIAVFLYSGCDGMSNNLLLGQESVAKNEAEITDKLLESIKTVSQNRSDDQLMRRFNQPKSLGCFDAEFVVETQEEERLRQGLFARPGHYPSRIRFASASKFDDREKDFRGMSIKVENVQGQPLWGKSGTQDFVLNSHPSLFAATPKEFLAFSRAMEKDRLWSFFINPLHWKALLTVLRGRKVIENPFAIPYWSTTPYRFGPNQDTSVKYSVRPCDLLEENLSNLDGENKLSDAMKQHLEQQPACFDFMVQFQKDPKEMPIEDASVVWDEAKSPFQKVATIKIENQQFNSELAMNACEELSFNPWQSLAEHRPLGGINRVRKEIYAEMAEFRKAHNTLWKSRQ